MQKNMHFGMQCFKHIPENSIKNLERFSKEWSRNHFLCLPLFLPIEII
ncbi:hypothetical protein AQPE_1435 [Aquipluma nitroreducens]|uniref:Uncharacterized protein n=1 Tax=Aquipluma nitroreducens TaxID=2010828 RepID=A0A5K7S6X1_9BACT|nr:hypothetical protein AQPE_1435 [Aquipluma nitroreducens]